MKKENNFAFTGFLAFVFLLTSIFCIFSVDESKIYPTKTNTAKAYGYIMYDDSNNTLLYITDYSYFNVTGYLDDGSSVNHSFISRCLRRAGFSEDTESLYVLNKHVKETDIQKVMSQYGLTILFDNNDFNNLFLKKN